MSMTDPIADLLTRLRNAQSAKQDVTLAPYSRLKENLVKILSREGYVGDYELVGEGVKRQLVVALKYTGRREAVILGLKRVSRPGCRVYAGFDELRVHRPGLGKTIISTPKGLMTDQEAEKARLGGEVLCQVW